MEEKIKDANPKRSVLKYILNSEIIFDDSRLSPLAEAAHNELHQTKKTFFETMGILAVMTGIYSGGLITRRTSLGLFSVVAGWLLCGFFLRVRWAPILMHGIYDTTAFLAIFFSLDQKIARWLSICAGN